jgi:uncharacterized protein (TIGR02118 family)
MDFDAFVRYWLGPHAEIARRIPGSRGYTVNVVRDHERAGWDGVAEMWFDSEADAEAAFSSEPVRSELAADRPRFLGHVEVFFVDEFPILPRRE